LVAVDIRKGSPSLGKWFGLEVSARDKKQVWAPAGFLIEKELAAPFLK